MADTIKKESEVTKVTTLADTDNVRVTLANGQSASIKKSDLMPIIKDELGKLLGNADALSTFTNVLVNNGQTLGKATIENLASVVSGNIPVIYFNLIMLSKLKFYIYRDNFEGLDVPYNNHQIQIILTIVDNWYLKICIGIEGVYFKYVVDSSFNEWVKV